MTLQIPKTTYRLQSVSTGKIFDDTGWMLDAPGESMPTLVRAIYDRKQLELRDEAFGIYRFSDWLPVNRFLKGSFAPLTYKSQGLADVLGLSNLYITFSGYWPEKGIGMSTCSFKETEAFSVCGRLTPDMNKILVVASAGNTARAFARVCSDNGIPLLLCVPEDNLDALWFDRPILSNVKLVCSRTGSDYFDAIHLSNIAAQCHGFIAEGGAKNVARRDGMGTTVLSAATFIGRTPDYYFQAVGSGTGAIAAWEANLRLLADGRFGNRKMKLMVSQNEPFVPMYEAWKQKMRQLLPMDDNLAREKVSVILAKVLSNRRPPYAIIGGLFDALVDADGEMLTSTNEKALEAAALFKKTEGNDIHPAAAVATASLIDAVKNNLVEKDAIIMLNITGGGEARFMREKALHYLKPDLIFDIDTEPELIKQQLSNLF